jgi:hypothetical protein
MAIHFLRKLFHFMYSDNWTAKFVKEKLSTASSNIKNITIEGSNTLLVDRKIGPSFRVFSMSLERIEHDLIREITDSTSNLTFLTNIKSDYLIQGISLDYLLGKSISFGGMGDLSHFAYEKNNFLYENRDYAFIKRGLDQHYIVKKHRQLDNRRISIERKGFSTPLIVATTYDYDVSIDSVRKSKSIVSDFKILLAMNPYGRITSGAIKIAESAGIEIWNWKDFLGKMNSRWR